MSKEFENIIRRHAARAVPLILVDAAIDQIATVRQLLKYTKVESGDDAGYDLQFVWSFVEGLQAAGCSRNYKDAEALADAARKSLDTVDPALCLQAIKSTVMPAIRKAGKDQRAGFIFYLGNEVLESGSPVICQLLLDLRNALKEQSSAILLVGMSFNPPAVLKEHIVILQAPSPTVEDYTGILRDAESGLKKQYPETEFALTEENTERFVEPLKGMSLFAAEQTTFLSTDREGMHLEQLRERAIQTINSTRGLSVSRGDGAGFSALGGLDTLKEHARSLLAGRLRPKVCLYMDEVEKALSGAVSGDTSGVSGNLLGMLLTSMQETNSLGMLFTGVYGGGKSEFAKRFGEEAGALTVHLDLAGMKDSLVGSSEQNLRRALSVIQEIGGTDGGILYMATSNRIKQLPPEFLRRFNLGTFFFYFPDEEERRVIWDIYLDRYKLAIPGEDVLPLDFDTNWTGAEIESCCRLAYLKKCTIAEAASFITPVAESASDEIAVLVEQANNKFLSTSYPGPFKKNKEQPARSGAKRKANFK